MQFPLYKINTNAKTQTVDVMSKFLFFNYNNKLENGQKSPEKMKCIMNK